MSPENLDVTTETGNKFTVKPLPISWRGTKHEEHQKYATRDRFVVNETISHHYIDGREPTIAHTRYNRFIESGEQPYVRHSRIETQPEPLDYGWIKTPSHVVIQNTEGVNIPSHLLISERNVLSNKIILVGIMYNNTQLDAGEQFQEILQIRARESCKIEPAQGVQLYIKSLSGANYTITAMPS